VATTALRGPSGGGSGHTLYLQHEGGGPGGGLVGNNAAEYAHMVEGEFVHCESRRQLRHDLVFD